MRKIKIMMKFIFIFIMIIGISISVILYAGFVEDCTNTLVMRNSLATVRIPADLQETNDRTRNICAKYLTTSSSFDRPKNYLCVS